MAVKRRDLSVREKQELLREYDALPKCTQRIAALKLGVSQPLLCKLLKNRQLTEVSVSVNPNLNRKRKRGGKSANVEEALLRWFTAARLNNAPISRVILCEKAKELANELGEDDFTATDGWLSRWKERHNVVYQTLHGGKRNSDTTAAKYWVEKVFPSFYAEFGPDAIFNTAETGLYFRAMPEHTSIFKSSSSTARKQQEKITVLLTCNMTGTIKKRLLVIGKGKNPACFRGVKKLPVDYKSNANAWMTSDIFIHFLTEWDKELSKAKQIIALTLDNCTAHPALQLNNIKLVFFPANTTAVVQPLEQGIIKAFKASYRSAILRRIMLEMDGNEECSASDMANNVSLMDAVHMLADAWDSVSEKTIWNCFCKACFNQSSAMEVVYENDNASSAEHNLGSNLVSTTEFEAWVNVDDNLATTTTSDHTVTDIVNEMKPKSSKDDDETEVVQVVPKTREITDALQVLRSTLELKGGNSDDYRSFYDLQRRIENVIMADSKIEKMNILKNK